MKKNNKRKAFTIVELVIVIAVISILAAVLIPTFSNVIENTQNSSAMQEARNAYTEYMIDYAEEGTIGEYYLYEAAPNRIVTIYNGATVGVYASNTEALKALLDDPDTTDDESLGYSAVKITGTAFSMVSGVNFSQMTYVAFGDSITYGVDGNYPSISDIPENHGEGKRYMANPYPELVGETLGFGTVNNQGVSSATFCQHQTRPNMTQKILAFSGNADIISLMLGVNDFWDKLPLGDVNSAKDNNTIYGSLYLIAEHLTETYPDAFIFFMTPFKCKIGEEAGRPYKLSDVANAIKDVAAQYHIPVLDIYTDGMYELEFNDTSLDYQDGIHPSQEHHINYTAPLISEFILKNYQH